MASESRPERSANQGGSEDTIFLARSPLTVPLDLREWVPPRQLADWVVQVVGEHARREPSLNAVIGEPPELRITVALSVLVYAYSTQMYVSDEIFRACHLDPMLHDLCGSKLPFPEELEHCRRKFRRVLEALLGQILTRAISEHFGAPDHHLPPGVEYGMLRRAQDRLNLACLMDHREEKDPE